MPSRDPVIVAFPPFFGFTRRLVIACGAIWFALAFITAASSTLGALLRDRTCLHPSDALREPWMLITYPFIGFGLWSLIFALVSLWFFGSELEQSKGTRWLREFFWISTIGGALLSVLLCRTVLANTPGLGVAVRMSGLWPVILAMTLAFARFFPERELRLYFVIRLKAKYLAAIYLLIYLCSTISTFHYFDVLTTLCVAAVAFLYIQFAPRSGLRFVGSEAFFGVRNRMERNRRRRAAKEFAVFMKDQGRDANLDASGKYISLDDETRDSRDRKWMN